MKSNEVHVWRTSLQMRPQQLNTLKRILSADELSRAGQFHFQRDKDHFIAARGLLRSLLGRYLDINPAELLFSYGLKGKPLLIGETGRQLIRFNVSHSHDLALFAVASELDIGVDLEYIRCDLEIEDLAKQIFSSREIAVLNSLPLVNRKKAFFSWWTRKEACLKASGKGLSGSLKDYEVVSGREDSGIRKCIKTPMGASQLCLMDLDVGPEYAAALAVDGHNWQLKQMKWDRHFSIFIDGD